MIENILKFVILVPFIAVLIGMCWFACMFKAEEIIDTLTEAESLNNDNADYTEVK